MELADGQPVVLCAHRLPRQHAVVAVLLPHRGHLPRLGAAEVLEGHGQLAQDAVPRLLQVAVRPPLFERPSLGRRVGRRAQLQLGVKRGHQREELRQLLVRAGPEVVDHAGQACGEDVHAVHEPQRAPAHLQALLAQLAEDSEAEVAVVALLDRGLQGAPVLARPWPWPWPLAQPWPWAWASRARFLLHRLLDRLRSRCPRCRCPRRALLAVPC